MLKLNLIITHINLREMRSKLYNSSQILVAIHGILLTNIATLKIMYVSFHLNELNGRSFYKNIYYRIADEKPLIYIICGNKNVLFYIER